MKLQKHEKMLVFDFALIIAGLIVVFAVPNLLTFLVGCFTIMLGVADLAYTNLLKEPPRIIKDTKGLAYIWIVAALTLIFTPVVYWAIGQPYEMLYNWLIANYTLTGSMASALITGRLIISFMSTFCLFGVLLWTIVNSKAESYGG